jgi:hypothetical protein
VTGEPPFAAELRRFVAANRPGTLEGIERAWASVIPRQRGNKRRPRPNHCGYYIAAIYAARGGKPSDRQTRGIVALCEAINGAGADTSAASKHVGLGKRKIRDLLAAVDPFAKVDDFEPLCNFFLRNALRLEIPSGQRKELASLFFAATQVVSRGQLGLAAICEWLGMRAKPSAAE